MKKYPLMRNNFDQRDFEPVIELLRTSDPILTNGPKCVQFENEWSDWLGCKYSLFVSSGTAANILSIDYLKILYPEGGEVIIPTLTWVSDVVSVIRAGFKPVFVDIDLRTLSMDTQEVLDKLTEKTRAVFITHCQGFNGLTPKLLSTLIEQNVILIEDVCESHGATFNGVKLGNFGLISNFSFYYAHHMSTIEGGMVCTNNEEVYQNLRMLRSHGMTRESTSEDLKTAVSKNFPELHEDFIFLHQGYNFRNNEIGALLGISQLKRLDDHNRKRTENFKTFLDNIDERVFLTDFEIEGSSNYAFNLILKNSSDIIMSKLLNALDRGGIEYRRGSAGGGNQLRQPYLRQHVGPEEYKKYKNTEHVHKYGLYLGNFPCLTQSEVTEICSIINSSVK